MEHPPSYSITHHYEALLLLREYYGFVTPLPLNPIVDAVPIANATQSVFCSIIGLRERDKEFFDSDIAPHAIHFLDSFTEGPGYPSDDVWDLASDNQLCVQWTGWFRPMVHLVNEADNTSTGFLFQFGSKQTVPWMIFVKDLVNVLLVC